MLGAISLLAGAIGCGNLSNEDLLFIWGVPTKTELELVVAANTTNAQALTYQDTPSNRSTLYAVSSKAALDLNGSVGSLLDFVDALGRGYPPTTRLEDARIWGPIENLEGNGVTMQLEIQRGQNDQEEARYRFCLAFAKDTDVTGAAPRCTEPAQNGYHTVLWGFYDPHTPEGSARAGAGDLHLDFEAMHTVGIGNTNDRGTIDIAYDFTQGGEAKQIDLAVARPAEGTTPASTASYAYNLDLAGKVDFYVDVQNVLDQSKPDPKPQDISIDAAWLADTSGRGNSVWRGGNLQADQYVTLDECWDSAQERTYWRTALYKDGVEQLILDHGGDALACPSL